MHPMFWAEKIADEVERRYADRIQAGQPIIVRDEKTASGHVHVGSLRSASLHALVADVLRTRGIEVRFYFEINDLDPFDGIPSYLDTAAYTPHLGKPLRDVPAPDGTSANFAEQYGREYMRVLERIGFGAEFYTASELYESGAMNEPIRRILAGRDQVREIMRRVSGSERAKDWYPLSVICEHCGSLSATRVTDFDGEYVTYECSSDTIEWADGCGHRGRISPFDGNAKLPWKPDWAAKFSVVGGGVQFEGGGKDHYSKGGARQVAEAICREVLKHEPPYGVFNEFFLVGGQKMSSSKGNAATAVEMVEILPPHLLRFLLLKTPINRQISFAPDGDAIPRLFDEYDKAAQKYFAGQDDDDARIFSYAHLPVDRAQLASRFLPRFSTVAFLVQMPHMQLDQEVAALKGDGEQLSNADMQELALRSHYAKRWLAEYASDEFKFELQQELPPAAAELTSEQRTAMTVLAQKLKDATDTSGAALHELIHEAKEQSGLSPRAFFEAIYRLFLGKESGPKAGWFLSSLDRAFVISRLESAYDL